MFVGKQLFVGSNFLASLGKTNNEDIVCPGTEHRIGSNASMTDVISSLTSTRVQLATKQCLQHIYNLKPTYNI